MGLFDLTYGELPTEIGVFPLNGALLLPGGKLPLNIFEPRYLALIEDSLKNQRVFGMIQTDAPPVGVPRDHQPPLFRVGCLGRLSAFSETDDGRFLITLTGMIRFRVAAEQPLRRGFRRVTADYDGFADDLAAPPLVLADQRHQILDALRTYFSTRGLDANWDAIEQMSDDALLVTLSMACPFDPAEKQALLEAPRGDDRADTLLALLRMAAHDGAGREARAN
jgi:Lon protease-like protein